MPWLLILILAIVIIISVYYTIKQANSSDEEYIRSLIDNGEIMRYIQAEINSPERKAAREKMIEEYVIRETSNRIEKKLDEILHRVKHIDDILSSI